MRVEPSAPPVGIAALPAGPRRGAVYAAPATPQPASAEGAAELARQAANRVLVEKGSELAFEFDDAARRVIVRLIDTRTGDVIRQFPSKQMLAIARALAQGHPVGSLVSGDA